MDCQTARLLLGLSRDCGPDDHAALDTHLNDCAGCQGYAAGQAGFDEAISLAMRDVPLPVGGEERTIRLASIHRAAVVRRQWLRGGLGGLVLLALSVAGTMVFYRTRTKVDTAELAQQFDYRRDDPERYITDWLKANGLPTTLPHRLDCRFFFDATWSDLQGKPAPCLQFVRGGDTLRVYLLTRGRFRLDGLHAAQSSFATVQPVPESADHPGVAYLLLYTSPTLDTFLQPVQ